MFSNPTAQFSQDARKLHLHHGPIDLIVEAWGTAGNVASAYDAASARFETILSSLVEELPSLRMPVRDISELNGPVALRMLAATRPFDGIFITPMAAVAGAVADEILSAMKGAATLTKAYVNNGGDIAVWGGSRRTAENRHG